MYEQEDAEESSGSSEEDIHDWEDNIPGPSRQMPRFVRPFMNRSIDSDIDNISSSPEEVSFTFKSTNRTRTRRQYANNNTSDSTHWFISFDEKYLKPIFTRRRIKPSRNDRTSPVNLSLLERGSTNDVLFEDTNQRRKTTT
jgi:hypothetical protein